MDPSQWSMSMNPAYYQNMANANVDWAALAQQWIQMKETLPPEQMAMLPQAPPPPQISHEEFRNQQEIVQEEKGEAPMEVEKDEEFMTEITNFSNIVPMSGQPQIPSWNNSVPPFNTNVPTVPAQFNIANHIGGWKHPAWQVWEITPPPPSTSPVLSKPPPLCPELEGYQAKKRWAKATNNHQMPAPPPPSMDPIESEDGFDCETIDAAKRKILPAWIREGLEKMEREKHREEERQKMEEERKRMLEERRKAEEEKLQEMESSHIIRSKFVSIYQCYSAN